MPIRKVKEITREREESQFVAHPSACHSQGTNVTDVSAASSEKYWIMNELFSIHLNSEPITALGTNRLGPREEAEC